MNVTLRLHDGGPKATRERYYEVATSSRRLCLATYRFMRERGLEPFDARHAVIRMLIAAPRPGVAL